MALASSSSNRSASSMPRRSTGWIEARWTRGLTASRSPSRLRWSSNSGHGLARGRHERPRHPHHDHDRNADQTAVGDQEPPKRRGSQGRIDLLGELDHPGRLVDDHHHEAEQHHATSQRRQGLERLVHGRRSRCRHHGLPNASISQLPLFFVRAARRNISNEERGKLASQNLAKTGRAVILHEVERQCAAGSRKIVAAIPDVTAIQVV